MSVWVWLAIAFFMGATAEQHLGGWLRRSGKRLADRLLHPRNDEPGLFGWHCGQCPQGGVGDTRADVEAQGDEHWRLVHHAPRRWQREGR